MIWSLRVEKAAKRGIRKLSKGEAHDVAESIRTLAFDPFPSESIALLGHRNHRRVRIGKFRVLYRVGKNTVHVYRIERRSGSTYRGFNPEE